MENLEESLYVSDTAIEEIVEMASELGGQSSVLEDIYIYTCLAILSEPMEENTTERGKAHRAGRIYPIYVETGILVSGRC